MNRRGMRPDVVLVDGDASIRECLTIIDTHAVGTVFVVDRAGPQCHRHEPGPPLEETAAMDLLVRQGKVLYRGLFEWSAGAAGPGDRALP